MENLTVLLADDQPEIRRMLRYLLEKFGFSRFLEAENGIEAINLIHKDTPDLVICDLHMKPVNGFTVLEITRNDLEKEHLPFIMLTADMAGAPVKQAVALNVSYYLTKPFSPEEVVKALQMALKRSGAPC